MSDKQSINYSTGLNAVAVDSVGNLVTDSAGNLVIPIEPVIITVESESNHSDCKCAIVNVIGDGSQTFMPCVGNMPFRQNSINWLGKATDIHAVQLVSNLRNVNMESLSFDIIAGIQVHRPVGEFSPSYMQVKIQWGDKEITSDQYYVCHQSRKVFNIGNININLQNNTLSYTGVDLPTNASSVKCEQKEEPEIIVIEAPYAWCNTLGSVIYTEDEVSGLSRYWANKETEVTVYPGEDREEKINEASLCCVQPGGGNVAYVTLESLDVYQTLSGDRYWKTYDTKSLHVEQAITVYRCFNKDTKEYLWVERYPDSTNTKTGRIWSYGDLPDNHLTACGGDYSTANNVKVKSPGEAWVTPSRNYTVSASVTYGGEDYAGTIGSPEFHIIPCGEKLYAQLVGTFHPDLDAPVAWQDLFSAALEIDGGIEDSYDKLLARFASQSPFAVIGGFVECSNGKLAVVEMSTMIKEGTIAVDPAGGPADDTETPYFEHIGSRYYITEQHGYLCEVTKLTLRKWAVSPCQEGGGVIDSVYLPEDKSAVYILSNNQLVLTNQIKILGSGSGQRMIVIPTSAGEPGDVYFWNGSTEPKAIIDEEFE